MSSPYETPKAVTVSSPVELPDGSVAWAVIAGFFVDIIGTIVVSALIGAAYGIYLMGTGMAEDDMAERMASTNVTDPHVFVASAAGLLVSYFAGRLCCRIAGRNARRAVTLLAGSLVVLGLAVGASVYSLPVNLLIAALGAGTYYVAYRMFVRANPQQFSAEL